MTNHYNIDLMRKEAKDCWLHILDSLGIPSVYLTNKHGPCPICGGKDRFRFDDKNGCGTFYCNQCGAGDGFKLLQLYHNWSFQYCLDMVARVLRVQPESCLLQEPRHVSDFLNKTLLKSRNNEKEIDKRRQHLRSVFKASMSIKIGDPVDFYLRQRGISLNIYPSSLRFHPSLPYYEDKKLITMYPAMLAVARGLSSKAVTIHRTYINNGYKANVSTPKKLMSPVGAISGSAIKLFEPIEGKLAIAEGIETALAFHVATGFPVWAAISAGGMEKIILPPSVNEVVIAADHDKSGRGQQAAVILLKRLIAEGRKVRCVIPPEGKDFNDILLEKSI